MAGFGSAVDSEWQRGRLGGAWAVAFTPAGCSGSCQMPIESPLGAELIAAPPELQVAKILG